MGDPVFTKEKKAQIKNELEALLSTTYSSNLNSDDNIDEQLAIIAAAPPLDFIEMNSEFEKQAKNITNSLLKFYVDLGVIEKHDYAKEKQKVDNSSIENILFQLKTIRMALEKISEEINQGNTHPRLFEVFGQLQDKLTSVVKTQANYMLFLEDTYKKMKQDIEQRDSPTENSTKILSAQPNDYYITAGTKNLIKELDSIEVEETEEVDTRRLTHPSKRVEIMIEKGAQQVIAESADEYDFTDDINSII